MAKGRRPARRRGPAAPVGSCGRGPHGPRHRGEAARPVGVRGEGLVLPGRVHVCARTHTLIHTYICTHTHERTHARAHAPVHTCTRTAHSCARTLVHTCTCIHTATHRYTCMHAHTHIPMHIHTCTRVYMCTCSTHTHTCTCTHASGCGSPNHSKARHWGQGAGDRQGPVPRPPRRAPRPRLLRGKNVAGRQTPLTVAHEPAPFLPAQGHGHGHRQAETASLSPSQTQVLLRHRDELTPAEGGGPTRRSHWGRQHEPESLAAVCETSFDGRIRDSDGLTREPLTE